MHVLGQPGAGWASLALPEDRAPPRPPLLPTRANTFPTMSEVAWSEIGARPLVAFVGFQAQYSRSSSWNRCSAAPTAHCISVRQVAGRCVQR